MLTVTNKHSYSSAIKKFFFLKENNQFNHNSCIATLETGALTYPLYNGYRHVIKDVFNNKSGTIAAIKFIKSEYTSISNFPFVRSRHIREIGLFHTDNVCCDLAKEAIKENNTQKLGGILTMSTLVSGFEIQQLGHSFIKVVKLNIFAPLLLRQIGTLGTIACGKELSKKTNENKIFYILPYFLSAGSTIFHNIFLKNLTAANTKHTPIIQKPFKFAFKQTATIFFISCLARSTFGMFSGAMYERCLKSTN